MKQQRQVTGVILAGGAGRRVQHRDKGLIEWRGQPLIELVAARLQPQVDSIVISCNRNQASYQAYAAMTVADQRTEFQGPLAGLEAVAGHVEPGYIAVTSCDVPLLPDDMVSRLLTAVQGNTNELQAAYAHDGERAHYLCAVIDSRCLGSLGAFLDSGKVFVIAWFRV